MPLFKVGARPWDCPDPADYDCLIISSANAIRHGGSQLDRLLTLPVAAVGRASADAAKTAGFNVALTGDNGAQSLLPQIRGAGYLRPLWLTGVDHVRLNPMPDIRHVYEAAIVPVPMNFAEIVGLNSVVALHSPRGAARFCAAVAACNIARADISLAALSSNIARSAGTGWKHILIAPHPDDDTLFDSIVTSYRKDGILF